VCHADGGRPEARRIAEAEGAAPEIEPAARPRAAMTDPEVRLRGPQPVRVGHQRP
jgi:hypothetical protein